MKNKHYLFFLGHPAHYHLFRCTMEELRLQGNRITVMIKSKDILVDLLDAAGIEYINVLPEGRRDGTIGIVIGIFKKAQALYRFCKIEKPDLMLGTAAEIAWVGKIIGIPSLVFNEDDVELVKTASPQSCESLYGFKTLDFGLNRKVALIAPYSPSWKAGLSIGDEIISVNGYTLKNDFNNWMDYFIDNDIEIIVSSNQKLKSITLNRPLKTISYFDTLKLKQKNIPEVNFNHWLTSNA